MLYCSRELLLHVQFTQHHIISYVTVSNDENIYHTNISFPLSHHSILRPSFSEPNLRQDVSNTAHGLSISSLRAILYDEHGSVLVSL